MGGREEPSSGQYCLRIELTERYFFSILEITAHFTVSLAKLCLVCLLLVIDSPLKSYCCQTQLPLQKFQVPLVCLYRS